MSIRSISVELSAKMSSYVANMRQAGLATKELAGEIQTLSETSKEKFGTITGQTAKFGLALTAVFAGVVYATMKFDKQMSEVQAVTTDASMSVQQVADQMDALRTAAINAGRDTVFSATEAAKAEAELAKAGVSAADILGGALKGSMALASAGSIDLANAATISAQAMNIFGLSGKDVGHIADELSAGANTSATDVSQLGQALNQAGLVAHQTGLSLEDTVGTLAAFAQNGLVGSDAGTSFKVMLQQLQAPSQKTADLMKQLGINAYDTSGKFIGITALAQNLQDKLGGLTQAQRDQALAQIFGNDAVRSADILFTQGAVGIQSWIDKSNQSGAAATTAAQKMNNLSGDVEQLKGSVETLAIKTGESAMPALRFLTQGVTQLTNAFTAMPNAIQSGIVDIAGITGVTLLAAVAFTKAHAAGTEFFKTLTDIGPAGEKAATLLGTFGRFAGVAGLVALGVAAFVAGAELVLHTSQDDFKPIERNTDALSKSLRGLADTGKITGELLSDFGPKLGTLSREIQGLHMPDFTAAGVVKNATALAELNEALHNLQAQGKADIGNLDTLFSQLATQGGVSQANLEFQDLIKTLGLTSVEAAKLFPKYTAAADDAAQSNTALALGFASSSAKLSIMNEGLQIAIARGETLVTVFNELNGANISVEETGIAFNQSLDDLTTLLGKSTKAALRSGKALDINSQAGRDNNTGILDTIDKANKAAEAVRVQTGSVEKASATYDLYTKALRKVLHDAGLTDTQINNLIGTFGKMPPAKAVPITTPGADDAINKAKTLHDLIYDIQKTKPIQFDLTIHGQKVLDQLSNHGLGSVNRWGGVYTHAATGALRDANVYGAVSSGARYAFAEPSTGGEGFVPKYGNYRRSTSIIDQEARWYGGRFVANGGGGSGGGSHSTYSPSISFVVNPQQANWSVHDQMALQATAEAMMQVGRAF
jgi:TP901 family phage tail tape measure protein